MVMNKCFTGHGGSSSSKCCRRRCCAKTIIEHETGFVDSTHHVGCMSSSFAWSQSLPKLNSSSNRDADFRATRRSQQPQHISVFTFTNTNSSTNSFFMKKLGAHLCNHRARGSLNERISSRRSLLLLVVTVVLIFIQQPVEVHGFANYLTSRTNCLTELSVDEVIMNQQVTSAEESDDEYMQIVFRTDDKQQTDSVAADRIIKVDSFPATYQIQVSTSSADVTDYQYVIDSVIEIDDETEDPVLPYKGGFMDGGLCDGKSRTTGLSANNKDTYYELTVEHTGAKIIAGWATGYETVRLTPTITFISSTERTSEMERNTGETNTNEEGKAEQTGDDGNTSLEVVNRNGDVEQDEENVGNSETGPGTGGRKVEEKTTQDQQQQQQHFLREYTIGFDHSIHTDFSISSYLTGSIILLVVPYVCIKLCIYISNKKSNKGRLD